MQSSFSAPFVSRNLLRYYSPAFTAALETVKSSSGGMVVPNIPLQMHGMLFGGVSAHYFQLHF